MGHESQIGSPRCPQKRCTQNEVSKERRRNKSYSFFFVIFFNRNVRLFCTEQKYKLFMKDEVTAAASPPPPFLSALNPFVCTRRSHFYMYLSFVTHKQPVPLFLTFSLSFSLSPPFLTSPLSPSPSPTPSRSVPFFVRLVFSFIIFVYSPPPVIVEQD